MRRRSGGSLLGWVIAAWMLAAACSSVLVPAGGSIPGGSGAGGGSTETQAPAVAVLTVQVTPAAAVVDVNGRAWPTRPNGTIVEEFTDGDVLMVSASAPGYIASSPVTVTAVAGRMPAIEIVLEAEPATGRSGAVRLSGAAFADDDGVYLGWGSSLFWALWGERNDAKRLDRNLETLAEAGVDYVRVLGMVGSESWSDRRIDPMAPDYWAVVDRFLVRAGRHGLRVQVSVFADAQVMMPDAGDRARFVDAWADRAEREPERFQLLEAANEYWLNGIESAEELRDLAARLNRRTSVLVSASASACGTYPEGTPDDWAQELEAGTIDAGEVERRRACVDEWRTVYGAGAADLATPHFDRRVDTSDGYYRPVRQPWEMLFTLDGRLRWANNEPIGPGASGASDDDPERLAMAAAVTWLSGGAGYVLHTGAGIRGGGAADMARGRASNIWEVSRIAETFAAIQRVRAMLPANLPNCEPANAHWSTAPFSVDAATVVRAYQSVCPDGTFVALPFGIAGEAVLVARRPVEVDGRQIPAGGELRVPGPSRVIVGRVR